MNTVQKKINYLSHYTITDTFIRPLSSTLQDSDALKMALLAFYLRSDAFNRVQYDHWLL